MLINADFSQIAIIRSQDYHWIKSPGGEVERVMFDRIGDETARATSLVRYAPQTTFPEHQHPQGEEIFVLSGVFTENNLQHYPAGWYLRNPHGSFHTPSSGQDGALIFVKLMQLPMSETEPLRINTNDPKQWKMIKNRLICPLVTTIYEHTYLERLHIKQSFEATSDKGFEILIINGQLCHKHMIYEAGTWIRLPPKTRLNFYAGQAGATLYIKKEHLGVSL
ncbi:cupin domain-containing protein [Acinetobacter baumannii]|uniref:cupin domain-containing protein n=1 Tax=Acinetobacter calcoaceticus/baumannii complex TaxID=909768 RepID=UPI001B3427C3|nr:MULTISPECIES: cupin domain-containing protein [Acinetobacter calcoaceticus/baumannii complex]MBP4064366.1 cupin domain-containing protein [Acinetobacter baumannii]MDH2546069.1 cupin domain-containing protein [Acinetobacter baumannii]MDH2608252.1 cupin domain-containing protein [Acinetobacter baumannii]MDO7188235.1 cupin domain-containing protein [Acinetobacter baumannii]MDO7231486.1 cupin domain-containing protein [Acinetobacter nosocomialis]